MKRLLSLLLAMLMLAGCASKPPVEEQEPPKPQETPTQQGFYEKDSQIESDTQGAVRLYTLGENECKRLFSMDDKLLLLSYDEISKLTALAGEYCEISATAEIGVSLANPQSCRAVKNGFVYYDSGEKRIVYLDEQLQMTQRIQLPEDMIGTPVIDSFTGCVYYCVANEVRGIAPDTGIPRLIKTHTYEKLSLLDCYFEGTVLACRPKDGQGNTETLYISTRNGETLATDDGIDYLQTDGKHYFALRNDSVILQQIWGNAEEETFVSLNADGTVIGALDMGGVVSWQRTETGLLLSYYDMASGKKTSQVELGGLKAPDQIITHKDDLWILSRLTDREEQVLCRWDVSATPIEDETIYTGTLFTADAPDEEGLNQCQIRASELSKQYGADLRIWNHAVSKTGDYSMTAEHQVPVTQNFLDALETVFAQLPENFLKKSANGTYSGKLHICLVREIAGGLQSVQYWQDADPYIVIAADADVALEFWKMLGYVVDSRVLGNSLALDDWDDLNPEGFAYSYDYAIDSVGEDRKYLEGEERAFIDEIAMCFPTEDRARIFAWAVSADGQACFASEPMQNKLHQLCVAIRDAYGLAKSEETFLWEQYLNESLAYQ